MDRKDIPKKIVTKYEIVVNWSKVKSIMKILTVIGALVGCALTMWITSQAIHIITGGNQVHTIFFMLHVIVTLLAFEYESVVCGTMEVDNWFNDITTILISQLSVLYGILTFSTLIIN